MVMPDCTDILFSNDGTGWGPAGRLQNRGPSHCVAARGVDGRDRLVCARGFGASDVGMRSELYVEEVSQDSEYPSVAPLSVFRTNGDFPCVLGGSQFDAISWTSIVAKDLNGDGVTDISAHLSHASSLVTPPIKAKLATLCAPGLNGPPILVPPADYLPPAKDVELQWIADAKGGYAPSSQTRVNLKRLPVWEDEPNP